MRTLLKPALVASAATASALRSTWVRSWDSQAMEGMATSSVRVCRVASKFLVTASLRALWWVNSVVMFLPYPHLTRRRRVVGVVSVAGVGLWGRVWCVPFGYDGRVFGRKKEKAEAEAVQPQVVEEPQAPVNPKFTPKKGRPTPSRKEQQAARRQPLVVNDRKEAKAREREAMAKARERQNDALMGGDQRYLPAVDRGSQRRYIRDYIDARRNIGDVMLFVMLAFFIFTLFIPGFFGSAEAAEGFQRITTYVLWGLLLLWIGDSWLLWRGLKKKVIAKFGEMEPRSGMYTYNRVMVPRRMRRPVPMVKYGEYPH